MMLKLFRDLLGKPSSPQRAVVPRLRDYAASVFNRLMSGFFSMGTSANVELQSLDILRARARQCYRDYEPVKRYIQLLKQNIVGPKGFKLQARVMRGDALDAALNAQIEALWKRWSKRPDAGRRWSLVQIINQAIHAWGTDGEVLIRLVKNSAMPHGLGLQVLEADYLDHTYNDASKRIRMGVELDEWGGPVAYWLFQDHPGELGYLATTGRDRVRVPADEIIHFYLPGRPGAVRGEPPLHASLVKLYQLEKYDEAELVNARVSSCKSVFFEQEANSGPYRGDEDLAAAEGEILEKVEPGTATLLPVGVKVSQFTPQHDSSAYDGFSKAMLRRVSTGMGVAYHSLTGDLADVNYSTARVGLIDEQDNWRLLQALVIDIILMAVYAAWLEQATLTEHLSLPGTLMPQDIADSVEIIPRSWSWVDPLKDAKAKQLAVANGFQTWDDVVMEQGLDPEEQILQLEKSKKRFIDHGLEEVWHSLFNVKGTPGSGHQDATDSTAAA